MRLEIFSWNFRFSILDAQSISAKQPRSTDSYNFFKFDTVGLFSSVPKIGHLAFQLINLAQHIFFWESENLNMEHKHFLIPIHIFTKQRKKDSGVSYTVIVIIDSLIIEVSSSLRELGNIWKKSLLENK